MIKNKVNPKAGEVYKDKHGQLCTVLFVGKKYLRKKAIAVSYKNSVGFNSVGFNSVGVFQAEVWPYLDIHDKPVKVIRHLKEEDFYGVLQSSFSPYNGCFVQITCKKNKILIRNAAPLAS